MQISRSHLRTLFYKSTVLSIADTLRRVAGVVVLISFTLLSAASCDVEDYPFFIKDEGDECESPIGLYDRCEGNCTCGAATRTPEVTINSVINECGWTDPATINGMTVTSGGNSATLSIDGTSLSWNTGAVWVRSCE